MYVELDIQDLLSLIESTPPNFAQQQTERMLELGRYSNAFDRWIWNDKVKAMPENSLYALYQECKTTK